MLLLGLQQVLSLHIQLHFFLQHLVLLHIGFALRLYLPVLLAEIALLPSRAQLVGVVHPHAVGLSFPPLQILVGEEFSPGLLIGDSVVDGELGVVVVHFDWVGLRVVL